MTKNGGRAASIVLAIAAAASLATGTLGFTSASAERGVQVNVVEPENGYVGVQACRKASSENGEGNRNGAMPVRVHVKTQFSDSFTVESITWSDSAHPPKDGVRPGEPLAPGETETFNNTFDHEEVTVTVTGGFEATVNVPVEPKGNCTAFT